MITTLSVNFQDELQNNVYSNCFIKSTVDQVGPVLHFNHAGGIVTVNMSNYAIIPLADYERLLELEAKSTKGKDRGYPLKPRN